MKLTEADMNRVDGIIGRVIGQHTDMHGRLRKDIYALLRAERERCAKIAEANNCTCSEDTCCGGRIGEIIAERIRAGEGDSE